MAIPVLLPRQGAHGDLADFPIHVTLLSSSTSLASCFLRVELEMMAHLDEVRAVIRACEVTWELPGLSQHTVAKVGAELYTVCALE